MKRRRYLTALGGLAGASSLAVGSGAFNFANVERNVSIDVADDAYAFLRLNERGSGDRSEIDGGTLEFNIPGDEESGYPTGNPTDPEGIGTDSVYRFGGDAAHDEAGLFAVRNQGTQPVKVYSTQETTEDLPSVTMYNVETGELLTESSPSPQLGVGSGPLVCGLEIDTHGVPIQNEEYDVDLIINAIAIGDD